MQMSDQHHESLDAGDSKDSALQYVDVALFETESLSPDERREIIGPVETEVKRHLDVAMREGMKRTFRSGPMEGAGLAVDQLKKNVSFQEVPEDHREKVKELTEEFIEDKHPQLAELFEDLMYDTLSRAESIPEDTIANWGPVV